MQPLSSVLDRLLDVTDDGPFDAHASWLAELLDAPIALVTVLEGERQRFAGMHGLGAAGVGRATPIQFSLCAEVTDAGHPVLIQHGARDRRFRSHPAVAELGLRAYLGVPLRVEHGIRVGAVCVADTRARRWRMNDLGTVTRIRDVVEAELLQSLGD